VLYAVLRFRGYDCLPDNSRSACTTLFDQQCRFRQFFHKLFKLVDQLFQQLIEFGCVPQQLGEQFQFVVGFREHA